jgi:hypothetical protein
MSLPNFVFKWRVTRGWPLSGEGMDDITLIWGDAPVQEVEFIQVKSNALNQLWTVAQLCKKDAKPAASLNGKSESGADTGPSCILERSLAHDRCDERCRFRIVTLRPVDNVLKVLTWPLGSTGRDESSDRFQTLYKTVKSKNVAAFKSERGRDYLFWLKNAVWQVQGEAEALEASNHLALQDLANAYGHQLGPDQRAEIYQRILGRVKDAAESPWLPDPAPKKISRITFIEWLNELLQYPGQNGTDTVLREKMNHAAIESDMIQSAVLLRWHYLSTLRRPQYLSLERREDIQGEIAGRLHTLRSRLYSGEIEPDGTAFHRACLQTVEDIFEGWDPSTRPALPFFQGCMYEMTNRCVHRFDRVAS